MVELTRGDVVAATYTVREEIARTETGVVFEARDGMLDRLVALKVGSRGADTPSMIIEARRCAAVQDPCAVAIYGMGTHLGMEYIAGERVTGTILRELLHQPLGIDLYLAKLRSLVAAVVHAHDSRIAIGEISGATILVAAEGRLVLGRLSLGQVPAFGPLGQIRAPEVLRGEVEATDPAAAEAIDLYGLGCIAIELAQGIPPFSDDDREVELHGHAHEPPPRLADLRTDLPVDLSDLIEWLLAKKPAHRPPSAKEVLAQLDAIIERVGTHVRPIRVLIVDDDTARARWLASLARRAYAAALVETASEGSDAAHKLNRDHPDLVFVSATLRGVMNALELCMYTRGLEVEHAAQLVVVGAVSPGNRVMFGDRVQFIADDANLPIALLERVRTAAVTPPRRRKPRSTVSG